MLGDIRQLGEGLWWIEGEMPRDNDRYPDIANALVYRRGDRLYIIDTGAGAAVRTSLLRLIEAQGPLGKVTLLNSHAHLDHICNNDVVQHVAAPVRRHYLSAAGLPALDGVAQFARHFLFMSTYFDPLAAFRTERLPRLLGRIKYRMAPAVRDAVAAFVGQERAYRLIVSTVWRKFGAVRASCETIQPIESLPRRDLHIGVVQWTGWVLGDNDVWVLEDRGHTPEHLVFYLPGSRLLHTGDTSFDMFRIFPDVDGEAVGETLRKSEAMARAGDVRLLTDGHHHRVFEGSQDIVAFLGELLADDAQFRATLAAVVQEWPGLTIPEIYRHLATMREVPAVQRYREIEFPHSPPSLQSVILLTLLQMGVQAVGPPRRKRFYLPGPAPNLATPTAAADTAGSRKTSSVPMP